MTKTESAMEVLQALGLDATLEQVNEVLQGTDRETIGADTLRTAKKKMAEQQQADEPAKFVFVFEEIENEDKDLRRARRAREYSRQYCAFRYAQDPEYRERRKASSSASHKHAREAAKAKKAEAEATANA